MNNMDVGQSHALADPVRLRLVGHLVEHEAATVAELARAAGVHANTARAHLGALEKAGVVVRCAPTPRGRGRPTLRFELAEHHPPPGADFRAMAGLLADAVGHPGARLRELARRWGRARHRSGPDLDAQLSEGLGRLGFRARLADDRVELRACPCPTVAPDRPETICALAEGVAAGIAAPAGYTVRDAAHDPERRRCTLTLERQ